MMNKRITVLTLSAALSAFAVGVMAPAALGHGNNPKRPYTGAVDPNGPVESPGGPQALSGPLSGGGIADLGAGPSFGGLGDIVDVPREIIQRWSVLEGLPSVDPGGDVSIGIGSTDVMPKNRFGSGSVQSVPRSAPAGGAIPTPGTLGLIGVAALILRRRRRRR